MVTDAFKFAQTGSRSNSGLTVHLTGTPVPTFESGEVASSLMGQALKLTCPGWVYLNASDSSLGFSGNSTNVDSFTVGFYVKDVYNGNFVLSEIVSPNFNPANDVGYWGAFRTNFRYPEVNQFYFVISNSACIADARIFE